MQDEIIQLTKSNGEVITTWNITTMIESLNERIDECQRQHFQPENEFWVCPVCSSLQHIISFIKTMSREFIDPGKVQDWLLDYQGNLSERAYCELTSLIGEPNDR